MMIWRTIAQRGASAVTATVFGVLAGIGGLTHGIGELVQGNEPVEGFFLDSWTTGPIATNMGGEPGLTVLPTTLWAGLLTVAFSGAVVVWSIGGVHRDHGGAILILLSVGMLLAGGGVGPPVIGMLAGAVGRWDANRHPRWVERLSPRSRRLLARAWPPLFAVAVANAVFLVIGSVVLVYTIDLDRPGLFEVSFYVSVLMLLAMVPTAPAYDAEHAVAARSDAAQRSIAARQQATTS